MDFTVSCYTPPPKKKGGVLLILYFLLGIPWMTGKTGLRTHFDRDQYLEYHQDKPQNIKYLEEQVWRGVYFIMTGIPVRFQYR